MTQSAQVLQPAQWQQTPKPKTDEELLIEELGEERAQKALAICDGIGSSAVGLERVSAEVMGKPEEKGKDAARVFYQWKVRSSALDRIYTRAMASRAHVLAHRVWDEIESEPDANKAKVKLDALKWLAAKFNRAQFGDDPLTIQGPNGGAIQVEHTDTTALLSDLAARLARKAKVIEGEAIEGEVGGGVRTDLNGGDLSNPPPTLPSPTQGPPSRVAEDAEEC